MSLYDAARIEKTRFFRLAPLAQGRGHRETHIIGFDTEASKGQPVLLQFSESGSADAATLIELDDRPNACLHEFLTYVADHCQDRNREHIVVGFNLQYEWTQLFGDLPYGLTGEHEFILNWQDERPKGQTWRLSVWNFKRHAMTIMAERSHVRVRVLDAAAFYPGTLKSVAKMVGISEHKDDVDIEQLTTLTRADLSDPVFRHYAAQDAVVTRLVGERIISMHEDYDIPTCMTAPHFASKVFRHSFLHSEVPLPHPSLEQAGLWSYHGGKNGFYLRQPTITAAWNLDIVSAYPEAMRALPAMETATWEHSTNYQPGVHALWEVRMQHHQCRFNGAMTHGGQHLQRGPQTVWLTSYELDVMIERNEAQHWTILDGWVMVGETGGGGFVEYVDQFFEMKANSSGPERMTAKLLLNSLYGKLFQKVPLGIVGSIEGLYEEDKEVKVWEVSSDPSADFDYRAGGLYHPPMASLVTGFVRAKVHRLEHAYQAIATSTDGLFARSQPEAAMIGKGLGQLTAEHGMLNIWRERLYDFMPPGPVAGRKVALHGFRGNADALREIPLKAGSYQYTAKHPVSLREAQQMLRNRTYRPGEFAELTFTLDLGVA